MPYTEYHTFKVSFPMRSPAVRPEHIPHVITVHTGVVLGHELLCQCSYSVLQKSKRHRRSLKMAAFSPSIINKVLHALCICTLTIAFPWINDNRLARRVC